MDKPQVVRAFSVISWFVAWVAVIVAISACDDGRTGAIERTDRQLNDAQVAQVLLSVSTGAIQVAEVAGPKAEAPQLKAFAAMIRQEHATARQAVEQTMMTRSISRDRSMQSDQVDSTATNLLDKLNVRTGADLEWEYLNGQVKLQQEAIALIEGDLLASVVDPELATRLGDMKSLLQRHLKEALKLEAALGSIARE